MKRKILILFCVIFFSGNFSTFSRSGEDIRPTTNLLMFQNTPNPCSDKCLIRTYLPENDPYSSIRILNVDSSLVKEISMGTETGISSAAFDVSDLENGTYYYQLFYKGETHFTYVMTVKH